MGFLNQERINLVTKVLAAKVIDANETAQWYESRFAADFTVTGDNVLTQLGSVPPAANLSQAQANALANPTIIQDASTYTAAFTGTYNPGVSALRLTPIPGTNGSTFVAYTTYNNFSSPRLRHWIQPQNHPQPSGVPSTGYAVRVFQGDPFSGGTEIFTSSGQTGTGINASVAWIFNYDLGMLLVSEDFRSTLNDPYILGFRYIGATLTVPPPTPLIFNQPGHPFVTGDVIWNNNGTWQLVDPDDWNQVIRAVGIVSNPNSPNPGDFQLTFLGEYRTSINPTLPGNVGDLVYIDPANPGKLTATRPEEFPHPVYIKLDTAGNTGLLLYRGVQPPRHNLSSTVNPTVTDDYSQGYQRGSFWINTSTNSVFFLADSTVGNAVWVNISGSSQEFVDIAIAVGNPNETFTSFFTNPSPTNVKCFVNGQLILPTGFTITGTNLQMVDSVNGWSLEPGDRVLCVYNA